MATKKETLKEIVPGEIITISPPNFGRMEVTIIGDAPYLQLAFSEKAKAMMREKMLLGSQAKKGAKREPRDFDDDFEQAQHRSVEGWNGLPAAGIRNACIDACRMCGFQMTRGKMSIFVEADGFDAVDGQPLIKIIGDPPEKTEMHVRNATGVADLRVRPMWRRWSAKVRLKYDADQFTGNDVVNLLARAGVQVGIGEGRPYSKQSNGLGYGTFTVQ